MAELAHIDPESGLRAMVMAATGYPEARVGQWPESDDFVTLSEKLIYVSVEVNGGEQDYFESAPIIDIDVFALKKLDAKNAIATIVLYFLRYPQSVVVDGRHFMVDAVDIISVPQDMPWEDPKIRRQSVTIKPTVRR